MLTGGLTKTPELAQILADVFQTPVTLLESAGEGTAWGAALLAKFRLEKLNDNPDDWSAFVAKTTKRGKKEIQSESRRSGCLPINLPAVQTLTGVTIENSERR